MGFIQSRRQVEDEKLHEASYSAGYEDGTSDGWDEALTKVLERSETYFHVDPASRRLVAGLVAKVKEEGR